ncbi:MAG: AbrB/MazE/SpoVT family DNA-binding domain-containing protein [Nitrospirae bacterium]|nr:AbrB/MazE/SpoVT family DNA-binding domain-containing protein [Nitrospirota bacterium]
MLRKVNKNFQVTLPPEFRNRFNVQEGDLLEVTESEEGVTIRPVEIEISWKILKNLKSFFPNS